MNTYKKLGNNRIVNSCVFQSFGHWSPVKYKFYTMIQYTYKYLYAEIEVLVSMYDI